MKLKAWDGDESLLDGGRLKVRVRCDCNFFKLIWDMMNPFHFSPSELQSQRIMAEPIIQIFKDIHELSNSAARSFVDIADQAIEQRGRFLVSLSGGNTPMKLYELLGSQFQDKVDWSRVHFFWGDERCVPADDPGNCYGQAKKAFLDKVNAVKEN